MASDVIHSIEEYERQKEGGAIKKKTSTFDSEGEYEFF